MKQLGVDLILATAAVGSLSKDFPRGTLVVFGMAFFKDYVLLEFDL